MLVLLQLLLVLAGARPPLAQPQAVPFAHFAQTCSRSLGAPLTRFWGTEPSSARFYANQVVPCSDPNLAILPRWRCAELCFQCYHVFTLNCM